MSKLITVYYTIRGYFIEEVSDDFNPKTMVDKDHITKVLGLSSDFTDEFDYQIDFRLGKEDK